MSKKLVSSVVLTAFLGTLHGSLTSATSAVTVLKRALNNFSILTESLPIIIPNFFMIFNLE